ncbi:MAG: hypothetical protein NTW78_07605 [Campylobacterales bacterium]|nr:hypothetical protein [Campylobacterales bacterium]
MKIFIFILLISLSLFAKDMTSSELYGQVMLIEEEVEFLLDHYKVVHHHHKDGEKVTHISIELKPRHVWQKTYEIMIKINILRNRFGLETIEPVNTTPVLNLNPDMVYGQTQRILTELNIFKMREGVVSPVFKQQSFKEKRPLDVFDALYHVSVLLDELNGAQIPLSFSYGETLRIYDDITSVLQRLNVEDNTIPEIKNLSATPTNMLNNGILLLEKIKQLQILAGIAVVDFSQFKKDEAKERDVFEISEMVLAELQTIKAFVGIKIITPAATQYEGKTAAEVNQLMSWNLRKLNLIQSLKKGGK